MRRRAPKDKETQGSVSERAIPALEQLEPRQLWVLMAGLGAGNVMLVLAYLTGARISSMRRLPDLAAAARAIPVPVQWHMVWGLSATALMLLSDLNALSWGAGSAAHVATMLAAFAASLTGAARLFMGGSGRAHLLAAAAGALAFAAGLAVYVAQALRLLRP